jgi:hypothetical protein
MKSSSLDREVFIFFIEEISFTEVNASDRIQLDDYFTFARALGDPPTTTLTTKLLGSRTHSIND